MSKDSSKDSSSASLPGGGVKFTVRGRNVMAFRVPLGRRIMLTEFFGKVLQTVAGEGKTSFGPGDFERLDKWLSLIIANAANIVRAVGDEYLLIIKDCTDIDPKWLEENCEIQDLVVIFRAIWEANGFTKTLKEIQAAGAKKKEVGGAGDGSKS